MATETSPNPAQPASIASPESVNSSGLPNIPSSGKSLKYLFSFICLTVPLLYWPPAFDAAGVPRDALIAVCAGLALILFSINRTQIRAFNWHPVLLMMLILLSWAILSYSWSEDTGSSQIAITQLASLVTLAVIASQFNLDDIMDYLIPVTLISATLAALIGIGQNFGINPLLFRMSSSSPSSTFINPNYAANYFDLITPAALTFLLVQPMHAKFMRWLATTAFAVTLTCLVICRSRGSWLGLFAEIVALVVIIVSSYEFRKLFINAVRLHSRSLIIALTIVVGFAVLPSKAPYAEKVGSIVSMSADTSIEARLHVYQNALVGIADHPLLGVGYGAFIMGFSPYVDAVHPIKQVSQNHTFRYMHSDPLQMFFETGIPGGVLSLAIILLVFTMCWRIIRSQTDSKVRLLALGLLMALLASSAHACVDFPLHLPTSAFYFWLWAGLATGLYLHVFPAKTVRLRRIMLIISGVIGLVFSLYSAQLYAGYLKANRDVFTAMRLVYQHKCAAVFRYTDRAMNEFGRDHFTRFWYAKVYTYCDTTASKKMAAMNRILALDPNMPLPYLTRARLELAKGELENAAEDFNHYRKLLPHRPEGYIGLAKITLRLHHKSQARYWLKLALRHAPNNPEIKQLVKQLNLE